MPKFSLPEEKGTCRVIANAHNRAYVYFPDNGGENRPNGRVVEYSANSPNGKVIYTEVVKAASYNGYGFAVLYFKDDKLVVDVDGGDIETPADWNYKDIKEMFAVSGVADKKVAIYFADGRLVIVDSLRETAVTVRFPEDFKGSVFDARAVNKRILITAHVKDEEGKKHHAFFTVNMDNAKRNSVKAVVVRSQKKIYDDDPEPTTFEAPDFTEADASGVISNAIFESTGRQLVIHSLSRDYDIEQVYTCNIGEAVTVEMGAPGSFLALSRDCFDWEDFCGTGTHDANENCDCEQINKKVCTRGDGDRFDHDSIIVGKEKEIVVFIHGVSPQVLVNCEETPLSISFDCNSPSIAYTTATSVVIETDFLPVPANAASEPAGDEDEEAVPERKHRPTDDDAEAERALKRLRQ